MIVRNSKQIEKKGRCTFRPWSLWALVKTRALLSLLLNKLSGFGILIWDPRSTCNGFCVLRSWLLTLVLWRQRVISVVARLGPPWLANMGYNPVTRGRYYYGLKNKYDHILKYIYWAITKRYVTYLSQGPSQALKAIGSPSRG